ncbi:acyltransferase [Providencia rettgeri]|nr:acyltransferase [Providencia rettgeri]MDT5426427.1 acyltransferase family protein [Providencia rettgeri]
MIKYRADIDGLRALAVMLVFAYHLKISAFSGGFIGVDVFFVISGFLITGIIIKSIDEHNFSLLNFFNRRIKRIIPNVALVALVTTIASMFILLPYDLSSAVDSLFFTSIYSANIYFMSSTAGYFSASSDEMPLLHMWSLSVEEQYYFIWPLVLIVIFKTFKMKKFGIVIFILSLISFFISQEVATENQGAAYYLLPTRMGGLLLGSSLALMQRDSIALRSFNSSLVVMIGIITILVSSVLISDKNIFPGFLSAIPCLGAAMIIAGGSGIKQNYASKLLSIKPIAFIGLLSFSIYLWHWPFIAFSNYLSIELNGKSRVVIILLTVFLSYLSLKFIENPIRKSKIGFSKSFLFFNLSFILISALLIFTSKSTNGFAFRFNENSFENSKIDVSYADLDAGWCHVSSERLSDIKYTNELSHCYIGDKTAKKEVLFIGDSTAGHYAPFVDAMAKAANIKVRQLSTSSCYPSLEIKGYGENPDICENFRRIIYNEISSNKYDTVIVSNRWIRDDNNASYKTNYIDNIVEFISTHAKKVVILDQLPEWEINPNTCIRRKTCNISTIFKTSDGLIESREKLSSVVKYYSNITLVDPLYLLSVDNKYTPFAMGAPMYHDTGHLSIKGMEWIADEYLKNHINPLR